MAELLSFWFVQNAVDVTTCVKEQVSQLIQFFPGIVYTSDYFIYVIRNVLLCSIKLHSGHGSPGGLRWVTTCSINASVASRNLALCDAESFIS